MVVKTHDFVETIIKAKVAFTLEVRIGKIFLCLNQMRTVPIINNLKIAWSDLLSNVFKGQGQTVGFSSVSAQYLKNTKGF